MQIAAMMELYPGTAYTDWEDMHPFEMERLSEFKRGVFQARKDQQQ